VSEERLARIEAKVDRLEVGHAELRKGQQELRVDVRQLRAGQDEMRAEVGQLRVGQDELRVEVGQLRVGQDELRVEVGQLRVGQSELRAEVGQLRTGQEELRAGQDELRVGQDELRAGHFLLDRRLTRVEVLQEEMRDLIKHLAEGHMATQALVRRESAETRAMIDRRITPLEESVRQLWRRVDPASHP